MKQKEWSDTPFDEYSRIPMRIKKMHVMQILKNRVFRQLGAGYRFLALS